MSFKSSNQQGASPGYRARKRSVSARRDGRSLRLVGKTATHNAQSSDSTPTKGTGVSVRLVAAGKSRGLEFGEGKKAGRGAAIGERKRRLSERSRERVRKREWSSVSDWGGLARNGTDCPAELESGESARKKEKAMRDRSQQWREIKEVSRGVPVRPSSCWGGEWRCQEGYYGG